MRNNAENNAISKKKVILMNCNNIVYNDGIVTIQQKINIQTDQVYVSLIKILKCPIFAKFQCMHTSKQQFYNYHK